ncbi:MAG TPA: RidA family protein [Kofleriaceae bacterium]|jgi:enamine deaminase RidA (YjgF/YER057c/UK114 family)
MSTELVMLDGDVPRGYADGRIGRGRVLHVAGQVGWKAGVFEAKDLVGQFAQALDNVLAVLAAAHAHVDDIAEMTIYVTDIAAYRAARKELGPPWRARFGVHFPAMALVAVTALVEPAAVVEIQAVAYLEHVP